MWIIAFFGMATIYAEAVLAQDTRVVDEHGNASGGPVYYIRRAFKGKVGKYLAGFFSVAIILALGFMGSLLSNDLVWELTDMFNQLMVIPNVIAMIALGALVAKEAKRGEEDWKNKKK